MIRGQTGQNFRSFFLFWEVSFPRLIPIYEVLRCEESCGACTAELKNTELLWLLLRLPVIHLIWSFLWSDRRILRYIVAKCTLIISSMCLAANNTPRRCTMLSCDFDTARMYDIGTVLTHNFVTFVQLASKIKRGLLWISFHGIIFWLIRPIITFQTKGLEKCLSLVHCHGKNVFTCPT